MTVTHVRAHVRRIKPDDPFEAAIAVRLQAKKTAAEEAAAARMTYRSPGLFRRVVDAFKSFGVK